MRRPLFHIASGLILLYGVLLIPSVESPPPPGAGRTPFRWNQDERWAALECQFVQNRRLGCERISRMTDSNFIQGYRSVARLASQAFQPTDSILDAMEQVIFTLGPMIAACRSRLPDYLNLFTKMRSALKDQSRQWDMSAANVRQRMYRLLYGGRAAVEEVLLQVPFGAVPPLTLGDGEPSSTPSTQILGVTIHSGDILVSRGGAPTSALIARGSDYPGNFSHVALVYVDDSTTHASIIESHIERGVAVATPEEYLRDIKLRVMVLRLRADLPFMKADPLLPHRVARTALERAMAGHIPYDFSMDFYDSTKLFCSEVASTPYRAHGVTLWMGLSSISTPGIVAWLFGFGVRHFETQEPSDLEYDPQLNVIAEWRDPETLYKDHIDNAATDVLLEGAERGEKLEYSWYLLPVGRAMKAYSAILNLLGKEGPIPEGMDAEAALRNIWFSSRHSAITERTAYYASEAARRNGYRPPYWELVALARRAKNELYADPVTARQSREQ
jgi:hypothetical protein